MSSVKNPPVEFVPPPVLKDIDTESTSDAETTIDSYIEKSPITNKFRIENPNLQPLDYTKDIDLTDNTAPVSPSSPSSSTMNNTITPIATPKLNNQHFAFRNDPATPTSFSTAHETNDPEEASAAAAAAVAAASNSKSPNLSSNHQPSSSRDNKDSNQQSQESIFGPNTYGINSRGQQRAPPSSFPTRTATCHAQTKPFDEAAELTPSTNPEESDYATPSGDLESIASNSTQQTSTYSNISRIPSISSLRSTVSIRDKMKRFSLGRLNGSRANRGPDDANGAAKRNRFSLNSSLSRLALHNNSSTSLANSTRSYQVNSDQVSINGSISSNSTINNTINNSVATPKPFWKYHILKFGKNLYLTTNPGLKHMYCRNGPGYYVEVKFADEKKKTKKNGFTLIFRDIENVESTHNKQFPKFNNTNNDSTHPPVMVITKKSEREGGYMTISIPRSSKLHHSAIKYIHKEDMSQAPLFNGLSMPKKFDFKYIPIDQVGGNDRYEMVEKFRNYEFKDFSNVKWNVGSIPRVRVSKMNKFKNRLKNNEQDDSQQQQQEDDRQVDQQQEDVLKFVGKKNIYFHQNYVEDSSHLKYKVSSNDPKRVYYQELDTRDFPPVLAMFRPYESKTRKRIINSFTKYRNSTPQNAFQQHQQQQQQIQQMKINHGSLDHDLGSGSEIRNYFTGGDGLYYQMNPSDDMPDDNKLGWITVYEDAKLFSSRGMFDIVVGLTLAVGVDSCLE